MKKILVVGCNGKMGKLICERLEKIYDIVGIDIEDDINSTESIDLVIDFSSAKNSIKTAEYCANNKVPLIIGATGQTIEENEIIKNCAKKVPILKAGNFSLGVMLIKQMIRQFVNFDLEKIIQIEKHHKNKIDKPSGTAVELEKFILKNLNKNVETHSVRAGSEIGEHELSFYFGDEMISLSHKAFSRIAFVDGLEIAISFMLKNKKKKLFEFDEKFVCQ